MNPPDSILPNGTPFSLSDSNGLIGSPVITLTGIKGRSLLTNQIKPIVPLTIKALIIQEQFGVPSVTVTPQTVSYNGDSRGEPWFTEFDSIYIPVTK